MRNFLATLLLSQGVPMLLAGDELGRTQRGNNNAYCQDNEISWVDWDRRAQPADLIDFARRAHRAAPRAPGLPAAAGSSAGELGGQRDISWLTPAGKEMTGADWEASYTRSLAVLLNGAAITEPGPRGEPITDQSFLLLFNANDQPVTFTLPAAGTTAGWVVVVDTASADATAPADDGQPAGSLLGAASTRELPGHAVVVLQASAS